MSCIKLGGLIFLFVVGAIGIPFFISRGQESNSPEKAQDANQERLNELSRAAFPSVNYADYQARPEDERRGDKYRSSMSVLATTASKDVESVLQVHWDKDLLALPTNKSDLIVVGTVKQVSAHLPLRKQTVYSVIDIEIERVFKHQSGREINIGETIKAEREGGVVRYPSGFHVWHRIWNQGMPVQGKRYYFFLSHEFPLGGKRTDLSLITAYEVVNGLISPLDTSDKFSEYKGRTESELRSDLLNKLGH